MSDVFKGFSPEAFRFLQELEANNNREWFQPRKEEYETLVRDPMLALVSVINAKLGSFAPEYVTDPKRAVFRVYRDTRFSPDKTPYKTHIAAWFVRRGLEKSGAGFYFSVSCKQVDLGGGLYHPPADVLIRVRTHIAGTHDEFRALLAQRKLKNRLGELQGEELTRPPKGFAADHPAIDLLKKKDWVMLATLNTDVAKSKEIVKEIEARLTVLAPLLEYLNRPLLTKKPGPFF